MRAEANPILPQPISLKLLALPLPKCTYVAKGIRSSCFILEWSFLEGTHIMIQSYKAEHGGQLSVNEGELVKISPGCERDKWCEVTNCQGGVGFIPSSHITQVGPHQKFKHSKKITSVFQDWEVNRSDFTLIQSEVNGEFYDIYKAKKEGSDTLVSIKSSTVS